MNTRWCWFGSLVALACTVRTIDEATPSVARNQCDVNKDCPNGRCSGGICVASEAGLGTLLFEVTPPATSGAEYASVRYLKTLSGLEAREARHALDLEFDVVASVSGTINAQNASSQAGCKYEFASGGTTTSELQIDDGDGIPGSVTFISAERVPGLPVAPYAVETRAVGQKTPHHGYELRMPPGKYDLHVMPWRQSADDACAVAPQILQGQTILAGDVTLTIDLPPPQLLRIEILGPKDQPQGNPLEGWRVDMVDPSSALVLSTGDVLGEPTGTTEGRLVYETQIYYSPVWDIEQGKFVGTGHELVRLRPPANTVGPSLFIERSSLELFPTGTAVIAMDGLSQPVHVEGQVELAHADEPVAAHLVFAATKLSATNAGYLTSFIIEADAGEDGLLAVDLLPGRYSVRAAPEAPDYCLSPNSKRNCPVPTEVDWEVGAEPFQYGRTLKLSPGAVVIADIKEPIGRRPLSGATVRATPVPVSAAALDELLVGTRAASGVFTTDTDSAGGVRLAVPAGRQFIFTVVPPDGSNYPWLVQPNLTTSHSRTTEPFPVDLNSLSQPLPVAYRGVVLVPSLSTSDPDGLVEVPGALIRAYSYHGSEGSVDSASDASFLVQVAETRAREDGTYELLVPSELKLE